MAKEKKDNGLIFKLHVSDITMWAYGNKYETIKYSS